MVIRDHWCTVQSTIFSLLAGASFSRRFATGACTVLGWASALGLLFGDCGTCMKMGWVNCLAGWPGLVGEILEAE